MGLVLSREGERTQYLDYELSNLKRIIEQEREKKKQKAFRFGEDESQTLEKLEMLAEEREERLIDSESLEHAFLLDTLESVRDTCLINISNMVTQAEIIVNKEFSHA